MGADSQKLTKPVTEKPATSRLFNVWHTNPMRFYDIPSGLANAGSGARLCKRRQRWTG
jgi:hypothetical protein